MVSGSVTLMRLPISSSDAGAADEGRAEVEAGEIAEEGDELHRQRLVRADLRARRLDLRLGGAHRRAARWPGSPGSSRSSTNSTTAAIKQRQQQDGESTERDR